MLDNDTNDTNDTTENDQPAGGSAGDAPPPEQVQQGEQTPPVATEPAAEADKPVKKAAARRTTKAPAKKTTARKTAAKKTTATPDPEAPETETPETAAPAGTEAADAPAAAPRKRATSRKRTAPRAVTTTGTETTVTTDPGAPTSATTAPEETAPPETAPEASAPAAPAVLFQAPEKKTAPARKRATRKAAAPTPSADAPADSAAVTAAVTESEEDTAPEQGEPSGKAKSGKDGKTKDGKAKSGGKNKSGKDGKDGKAKSGGKGKKKAADAPTESPADDETDETAAVAAQESGSAPADVTTSAVQDGDARPEDETDDDAEADSNDGADGEGGPRRRRRRGGRRRRKPSDGNGQNGQDSQGSGDAGETDESGSEDSGNGPDSGQDDAQAGEGTGSRRRRRRRRTGEDGDSGDDDHGSSRARKPRNPEDEITSIGGSTRLEAKKQRRREGREAGRRRAPIVSEAEFLARRESVDRVMVIRQHDDLTQIGVLEDKVLVEHYVARESQTSLIGNVYLGRVQNVLPSMEAAFIDIGKGRNAVLYAGEVNWAALGHKDGQQRKIESVLSSGQTILVQVTKDPIGHKGARLTGQVSLPGRFLVYVPEGNTSGISRKLPDTERHRLKTLLKEIVPDTAGVIVRTAAEGASEEELTLDVERLTARWSDIEEKVKSGKGPQLLYGEPDLTLKVVRDLFTEDFAKLVVQGEDAWDLVEAYVSHVAPDLQERLERFEPAQDGPDAGKDLFTTYRVDEQIAKGLDRKVWLPSGGSLIIDRTEAMTVVDVNTGKFTGSGGNLEETVTKNNLEAAEEMVRQLRLRDIGGIIVIDFIDMVLESNRDLVLRRLVECLGRDRTRHQVAEVTSLGLVQMTRKRIGTGLLEAFSHDCEHCKGRGVVVEDRPVDPQTRPENDDSRGRGGRSRGGRNRGGRSGQQDGGNGNGNGNGNANGGNGAGPKPSPAVLAHSRPPEKSEGDEQPGSEAQDGAEQTVIGRPTGHAPEPVEVPTETQATGTTAPEVAPGEVPATPAPTGAASAAPEAAPAAPEGPRVVTSTRRRSARRAAGPPVGAPVASSDAATDGASTPVPELAGAGRAAAPSAEPVSVPVEPAAPGHAPGERLARPDPRVQETTSQDAGTEPGAAGRTWPADAEGPGDAEADNLPEAEEAQGSDPAGLTDPDAASEESEESEESVDENGFSVQHVPIKRKGRKR